MKRKRSYLYFRLATLIETGISTSKAFKVISSNLKKNHPFAIAAKQLEKNGNLQEALVNTKAFSSIEISLSLAGEKCGNLPETWRYLSKYYEQKEKNIQKSLSKLIYPVFLIHAAIMATNLSIIVSKNMATYLSVVVSNLLTIYVCASLPFFFYYLIKNNAQLKEKLDNICIHIPFIKDWAIYHNLSDAFAIIYGMYYSGINIKSAFKQAQHSISFQPLQLALGRISQKMQQGDSLEEAIETETILPGMVKESIIIGETSGKLDSTLREVREISHEKASQFAQLFLYLCNALITGFAMLWVVSLIFSGFSSYTSAF